MNEKVKKARIPWFKKPSQKVSERMKRVKSKGTGLEKAMESLLKKEKMGFHRHPLLVGKPDFMLKNTSIVIFCDSSFWHGRRKNELNGKAFKKNKSFWTKKLMENRKRDLRTNHELKKEGWKVLRFWDSDIIKKPDKVILKLKKEFEKR